MSRNKRQTEKEAETPCDIPAPPEFAGGISCPPNGGEDENNEGTLNIAPASTETPQGPDDRKTDSHTIPSKSSLVPKERHILWKLFWSFLKIGIFTFGGGYAMIPLIQREVTDKRGWVEPSRFLELFTLAQSAPGPISLNTAVFVGYNLNRYKGAAAAIFGTILPSFVILLLIAVYFADIKDNNMVESIFKGMRPAVVALIVAPLLGFTKGMGPYRIGIAVIVAAAIWRLGFPPALCILIGALGGLVWVWLTKRKEARK